MLAEAPRDPDEGVSRPTLDVTYRPERAPTFAAIVRLGGEHDLSTRDALHEALEPIYGDVLVDLSDAEFIDSSVIGVLLATADARRREGQRLELLVPARNARITRTLTVAGVTGLLAVRTQLPEA